MTAYKSSRYAYEGTETTEVTIVRTGGAADPTSQVQSRKIVTTANAQWLRPFQAEPYAIWNPVAGADVTATVYGIVAAGALPNNDDLWMEVEYLTLGAERPATFDGFRTDVTMSNGDLTVTHNTTTDNTGAMSMMYLSTGKYYFEVTVGQRSGSSNSFGIILQGGTFLNAGSGFNTFSVFTSSNVYSHTSSAFLFGPPIVQGDVVSFAIDLDARLGWIRVNNGNWNNSGTANPAASIGGISIIAGAFAPFVRFGTPINDAFTGNFGQSSYAYSAPSGFGNWASAAAAIGKIVTTTKASLLASNAAVASDSSTWGTPATSFDGTATSEMVLSNGNLTATHNGNSTNHGVISTAYRSGGKYYFEMTIQTSVSAGNCIGVMSSDFNGVFSGSSMSTTLHAVSVQIGGSSTIYSNGVTTGINLGATVTGDVFSFALDLNARLAWIRKNGGNWNANASYNPATGVGGIVVAAGYSFAPIVTFTFAGSGPTDAVTANFGASAYAYTPPSGFLSWDTGWVPFKLTKTLSSPQPGQAGYLEARVRVGAASATYYIDPKVVLTWAGGGTINAATAYKSSRYAYEGTETTETAITRTGGAADPTGQAQSRKIVTTANAQWLRPFQAGPYAVWNPTTGANVTVTVYGTVNSGALPNNDDIWLEVEYLGSGSSPLGTVTNTTKSNLLASNAAVALDSSTWGTPATSFDGVNTLVALSNGNLTVTHNNTTTNAGAISTAFLSGGKYYFEVTIQATTTTGNASGIMVAEWPGVFSQSNLTAYSGIAVSFGGSSLIYAGGATTGVDLGATSVGNVFCFAVDIGARLGWARRNNGNWNANALANPTTGVGGFSFAAVNTAGTPVVGSGFAPIVRFAVSAAPTDAITANFGASAYAQTPPSGFLSWDTGWTPFKLTKTLSSPQPGQAGYLEARVRVGAAGATYYLDPKIELS